MSRSLSSLQRLCGLAMLTALAYLTMLVLRVPLFPAAGFLKYEAKDVVLALAGLLYGPAGGAVAALTTCLLEMFTVSDTGWIGFVMNLLSSLLFLLPSALLCSKKRTAGRALCGLTVGALLMCAGMLLWNVLLTPLYMGVPRQQMVELLLPVFLPFNLLKGLLNAGLAAALWSALLPLLQKARLLPPPEDSTRRFPWPVLLPAAALIAGAILCARLL